ncbi:hypothetical protein ACFY0A_45940 [Streptomyces sp. NPDC001698]|uniref:hypothetical protein n=1 Tax=unclassified Streptomyces TaxID=2593676 RepID=UPI0036B585CD
MQGLVGSPGWMAFGDCDGDRIAIELTPGPGAHPGQVIILSHEESIGARLTADSLTEMVLPGRGEWAPLVRGRRAAGRGARQQPQSEKR